MRRDLSIPQGIARPERKAARSLLSLLAILAALLLQPGHRAMASMADDALVQTESGFVRGTVGPDYRLFLGIPYAAPPIGNLRWRPPQPAPGWGAARDATVPAAPCPQSDPRTGALIGSEDCLYLDITTPYGGHADRPLPVMVWVHGGGFVSGSSAAYDGRNLATKGNVVVVTLNYRLGMLGFLAHLALDTESPDGLSGNFGLADQQAALRWIQRNIAAFGGDPLNITIFGDEAGANSICAQLVSPGAAGLFERAIVQNGNCVDLLPVVDAAEKRGDALAQDLGCDDPKAAPDCLRGKSISDLLKVDSAQRKASDPLVWGPVVGAAGLPLQPADGLANGTLPKISLMVGAAGGASACATLAMETLAGRKTTLYGYDFADTGSDLPYLFATELDRASNPDNLPPIHQALADQMIGYWSEFAHKGDPNGPGLPAWPQFHTASDVMALAPVPEGSHPIAFDRKHHCGGGRRAPMPPPSISTQSP
ncbi:MAG TPA: carboxylesterase family protein [Alphaproteobacteria bacterium]|nr:carboxylesterase family protein [Alphaproteobacteria bacterium]